MKDRGSHPVQAHLEPEAALLDGKVTDLAQIPRVNVTPCIALADRQVKQVFGEVFGILVRLHDVSNPERVNVDTLAIVRIGESPCKRSRDLLADQLGEAVRVHRVDRVLFREGQLDIIGLAKAKADAKRALARRDHNLLDAELGRRLDDIVRRLRIGAEGLVVGHNHVARVRRKMDDDVGHAQVPARLARRGRVRQAVLAHRKERGERVPHLTRVGQVGLERVHGDRWVREIDQVQVEHLVPLADEVGDDMAAGLAAATGEDDSNHTARDLRRWTDWTRI